MLSLRNEIDLTSDDLYVYYINNEQLSHHQSLIYGLRELTLKEYEDICVKNSSKDYSIGNEGSTFTSNYFLRIYTSGCYYLDRFNNWQSDGLIV